MPEPKSRSAERRARTVRRAGLAALAAVSCAASGAAGAQALEPVISGYITVTSDYRHRGRSESGGDPSFVVAVDYQRTSGFFAGAWAARIEYGRALQSSSDRFKIGYYLGLSKRIERWSWTVTALRYTYPGLPYDYDYNELAATAGFRDRLFVTAAYVDDLFARGASAFYSELGAALPLTHGLELGATLGRVASSDPGLEYTHWNIGLSKTFAQRVALDVRYYDDSRHEWSAVGSTNGDSWVLSASYGFRSR